MFESIFITSSDSELSCDQEKSLNGSEVIRNVSAEQ